MSLTELNNMFIGDTFFYNGNYLGVIRGIEYTKLGFYTVYFYDNSKPANVSINYMKEYYLDRLKRIRMSILRNRRITKLVHFTPISNLENIFKNGMLSRSALEDSDIDFTYSDSLRLDGKLDYISNSITFPNYKMFYPKRMFSGIDGWAVLSISSEVLIDKFDTEFYRMNAAANDPLKCRFEPTSNDALEDMFYPEDRDPSIPVNYTTDPQAEVLVKDSIDTSYITCIDTEGPDELVEDLAKNCHVMHNENSKLFIYRKDYARW